MSSVKKRSHNYNNLETLKKGLIDLLFCLEVKQKTVQLTPTKKFIHLKKDIYFALHLFNKFQSKELTTEDLPLFIEYASNLYALLYDMVYEPAYFLREDYNTFIIEFKRDTYENSTIH